jgi:hypothetical protein
MENQVFNTMMIPVEEYEALRRKVEELTHCYNIECANHKSSREQLDAMQQERDEYLRDLAAMKNWIDDWYKKDAELAAMRQERDKWQEEALCRAKNEEFWQGKLSDMTKERNSYKAMVKEQWAQPELAASKAREQ